MYRRNKAVKYRAFTLIETALATIIVGVGVLAIVAAQQAFHQQNEWSSHASIAMRLGNEIREMTLNLPRNDPVTGTAFWGFEAGETLMTFDDLDDYDNLVFSEALGNGPINAQRKIIPNMPGWSQTVFVQSADPFDITLNSVPNNSTNMMKVEVLVEYQGPYDPSPQEVTRVAWISPQ